MCDFVWYFVDIICLWKIGWQIYEQISAVCPHSVWEQSVHRLLLHHEHCACRLLFIFARAMWLIFLVSFHWSLQKWGSVLSLDFIVSITLDLILATFLQCWFIVYQAHLNVKKTYVSLMFDKISDSCKFMGEVMNALTHLEVLKFIS